MTTQYTRAMLVRDAAPTDAAADAPRRYRFRAATANVARDGMVIPADEWRTDAFEANPVILVAHDYFSMPIGRAATLERDDEGLLLDVEFDTEDPRAIDVMRKLDGGFVNAMSVGFRPARVEWPANNAEPGICRDVELLEASVVAVPSDPGALAMRANPSEMQRQLDRLAQQVEALAAQVRQSAEPPQPEATPAADPTDVVIDEGLVAQLRSLL